jgi:hypothetical protein
MRSIVLSGCIVSPDCKDAIQLTERQCIGSQEMIDLNLTTSIASDDGLTLLLLDVSTQSLPGRFSIFTGNRNISLSCIYLPDS